MKLRSGKTLQDYTNYNEVTLSQKVKNEIRDNLVEMKAILKDDHQSFSILIEKSLLLGKSIYIDQIYNIIRDYHDLYTQEDKSKLQSNMYFLSKLISCENPAIVNKLMAITPEVRIQYKSMLRDKIEEEIHSVCNIIEEQQDLSIAGQSIQPVDDM